MLRGAGAEGAGGEVGLAADGVGEVGGAAGVAFDNGKVFGLADDVKGAQGLPDNFGAGGDFNDRLTGGNRGAVGDEPAVERAGHFAAELVLLFPDDNAADERAGVDGVAGLEALGKCAGERSGFAVRLEHGEDYGAAGGIAEMDKRKRGVALDHGVGVGEKSGEGGAELGKIVRGLAHDGCRGEAKLGDRARGEGDELRVPAAGGGAQGGVGAGETLGELKESVLDFAGMGEVSELFVEVGIRERAAKPGGLPEQKGHQDEEKGQGQDEK